MKNSLLNPKMHSASLVQFADECKKIIRASFQYLVDEPGLPELEPNEIKKAVSQEDDEKLFEFTQAALVRCNAKIEEALAELFDSKLQGIIRSSQVFAMLSMLLTIAIQAQDIGLLRRDIAESDIGAKSDEEAFHGLLLGVLDTIYELSVKKMSNVKEENQIERVLN